MTERRTGEVFELPANTVLTGPDAARINGVPCYDSPVLIADRRAIGELASTKTP